MVVTWTWGGTTGGYCATGSRRAQIPPTRSIRSAETVAKIGRRMKKSTMTVGFLGGIGLVRDRACVVDRGRCRDRGSLPVGRAVILAPASLREGRDAVFLAPSPQ